MGHPRAPASSARRGRVEGGLAGPRPAPRHPVARAGLAFGLRFALALLPTAVAAAQEGPSVAPGADVVVLFTRDGCGHCARARTWLETLAARRPALTVQFRDVVRDPSALAALEREARAEGLEVVAVPAVLARGRLFVGFDRQDTTDRRIEAWLDGEAPADGATAPGCSAEAGALCASPPESAAAAHSTPAPPPPVLELPWLGEVRPEPLGLPLFTVVLGLLDGFNPCAMWVLLMLLSMLAHLKDRGRMAWIAGTFVLTSALVYYAFMAAWLELYVLVGPSRGLQIGLGIFALGVAALHVKDFFAPQRGPSLSIPASAKPGLLARMRAVLRAEAFPAALVLVAGLAVAVNFVELLCTTRLPALYTQVLAAHALSRPARHAFLALYVLAHMADDLVMVTLGVITLGHRKVQPRGGRWLKLVSGVVLGAIGAALLFAPGWLAWG